MLHRLQINILHVFNILPGLQRVDQIGLKTLFISTIAIRSFIAGKSQCVGQYDPRLTEADDAILQLYM